MRTFQLLVILILAGCGSSAARQDASPEPGDGSGPDTPAAASFSFFVTSTGGSNGGDFRRSNSSDVDGLAGADAFCQARAAAGAPASASRQWRAYLSTDTVNAKERIGAGPWFNRNGVMIAANIAALHDAASNLIDKATALDERGNAVPGRGDIQNEHDILTGSTATGDASANHCNNWTSSVASGVTAQVGHHDRMGTSPDPVAMSWNSAHATNGCSEAAFIRTGGRGSIYCFAAD